MAANTKTLSVLGPSFHSGIEAAPEDDAADKTD